MDDIKDKNVLERRVVELEYQNRTMALRIRVLEIENDRLARLYTTTGRIEGMAKEMKEVDSWLKDVG